MGKTDPAVFMANDIRGRYPEQVDDEFAFRLGSGLCRALGARSVVIAHDARLSSPSLYRSLASGLEQSGARVDALGICPTELLYYVVGSTGRFDAGVMVTASHNPPEFNGFKLVRGDVESITLRSGLASVRDEMMRQEDSGTTAAKSPSKSVFAESEYVDYALKAVPLEQGTDLKVVVDPGSGVGGILWQYLADRTGLEPVRMNFEPDGRFPGHVPDPSKLENLLPLRDRVVSEGADLGLAYDGDADRVLAVLAGGRIMDGSETVGAVADGILRHAQDQAFAFSLVTSRRVLDFFGSRKREPLLVPVGHAKVKNIMKGRPELAFAGEESGHCYYREFFCADSGLLTTLHLLRLASARRLRDFVDALPARWFRPEKEPSFPFREADRARQVCRQVASAALVEFPGQREILCEKDWQIFRNCSQSDILAAESVRVDYEDWWFCVRPSATEPIARLTVESASRPDMEQKVGCLCSLFDKLGG